MTFELDLDEINVILIGLSKLPLEQSVSVWAKIKQDAEKQIEEKKDVGVQ